MAISCIKKTLQPKFFYLDLEVCPLVFLMMTLLFSGRKDFLPSLWEGTFVCPNGRPQSIVMNVSHDAGSILTNAELQLFNAALHVQGTYANLYNSLTLTLEGTWNTTAKVQMTAQHVNTTRLLGSVILPGVNCSLSMSLTKCEYISY